MHPGHSKAAPLRKHLYGFGSSGSLFVCSIGIRIGQNEGVVSNVYVYLEVVPLRCTLGLEMSRSNFNMGVNVQIV